MGAVQESMPKEDLLANLRWYGLPVWGPPARKTLPLEEALAAGLVLARRKPAVARGYPVVLSRNRGRLDPEKFLSLAAELGEERVAAFLLWVTGKVSGDQALRERAQREQRSALAATEPDYFFLGTSEVVRKLARLTTEAFAKSWGFYLGADLEGFFGDCHRKHMSVAWKPDAATEKVPKA